MGFCADNPSLQPVILATEINDYPVGQHFFFLKDQSQVFISFKTLKTLRFKAEVWTASDKNQPIPLDDLSHAIQFQFDQNQAILHISALAEQFESQVVYRKPPPTLKRELIEPVAVSGFANYQLNVSYDLQTKQQVIDLPFSLGLKVNQWLAHSGFQLHQHSAESNQYRRLLSYLNWDDQTGLRRVILGDFSVAGGTGLTGGLYGGISLQKSYDLDSQFARHPSLDLLTNLQRPTQAELFIDEVRVDRWQLQAGQVVFSEILNRIGQGNAVLVLDDGIGETRRLVTPFYISTALLKPGLHDYAYHLGARRQQFAVKNNDYGRLNLLGFHRYGLRKNLTAGAHFELNSQLVNIGPMLTMTLGGHSELRSVLNVSRQFNEPKQIGTRLSLTYQYQQRRFGVFINAHHHSRDYTHLNSATQQNKNRSLISVGVTIRPPKQWGSFRLAVLRSSIWQTDTDKINNQAETTQFSLTYHKRLTPALDFFVDAEQRRQGEQQDTRIFMKLRYSLGNQHALAYSGEQQRKQLRHTLWLAKKPQSGKDFSYDLRLHQQSQQGSAVKAAIKGIEGDARLRYQDYSAHYQLHYRHLSDGGKLDMSMVGGMGWIPDQGIHFSPSIHSSFALVDTGMAGIPVRYNHKIAGISQQDGKVLVPNLTANHDNPITISPADLAMNQQLDNAVKYVKATRHSGSLLRFEIQNLTLIEGWLYQRNPATATETALSVTEFDIKVGKQWINAMTGKQGYFYLENLPVGDHAFRVILKEGVCQGALNIADSQVFMRQLGKVYCE